MEQETVKTCKCCNRTLDISNFKKGRWGYVSVCNECDKQHRAEKRRARIVKAKQKIEDMRAENRQLCLADFTPRELMTELARRGYRGKLQFTQVQEIEIENF